MSSKSKKEIDRIEKKALKYLGLIVSMIGVSITIISKFKPFDDSIIIKNSIFSYDILGNHYLQFSSNFEAIVVFATISSLFGAVICGIISIITNEPSNDYVQLTEIKKRYLMYLERLMYIAIFSLFLYSLIKIFNTTVAIALIIIASLPLFLILYKKKKIMNTNLIPQNNSNK